MKCWVVINAKEKSREGVGAGFLLLLSRENSTEKRDPGGDEEASSVEVPGVRGDGKHPRGGQSKWHSREGLSE